MNNCDLVSDFEEMVYHQKMEVTDIIINIETSGPYPSVGFGVIFIAAYSRIPNYAKNLSYCDYFRPECKVDRKHVEKRGMGWFLRKDSLYEDANTVYGGWMDFRNYMSQFKNPRLCNISRNDRLFLVDFHKSFLKIVHNNDNHKYSWLYDECNEVSQDLEQRK